MPDFDEPAAGVIVLDEALAAEPETAPEPLTAEMLASACAQARAAGRAEGLAEAAAARDAQRLALLDSLAGQLRDADARLRDVVEETGSQLSQLVVAVLAAAFPAMCARHGGAEVAQVTRDIVRLLAEEPRIVIRVNPAMADDVEQVLAALETEQRQAILVETRAALAPGDVRIAWRHGMAVRDAGRLWAQVADILAPLGLTPTPAPVEPAAVAA